MNAKPASAGRFELLAASLLTGVFGAATIYASEAHLGLDAFAPLAQLWTLWALFAASVTFSVQHWVIRSVVAGADDAQESRLLLAMLAPVTVCVIALAWLLADSWFDGQHEYAVVAGMLVLGTGLNGYGRGRAAARDPGRLLAIIIVGENLIRLVLLVPLVVFDATPIWYGIALLAGFLINFIARPRRSPQPPQRPRDFGSASSLGFVVTAVVGLVGYVTMFGGPLLLGPAGVSAAMISALFLVITLARVPFIVVLGLLPRVALHLELLVAGERGEELRRFTIRVGAAALGAALGVGTVAALMADRTVGRLLGTSEQFGGDVYALVGTASVLSLASLLVSMALVAQRRYAALSCIWALPVAAAGIGLTLDWFNSVERLSVWLLVMELVILTLLSIVQLVRSHSDSV